MAFEPRPFNNRIHHQKGLFTYHPDPNLPLKGEVANIKERTGQDTFFNLNEIKIPAQYKLGIINELHEIGIDHAHLFPGFDGLSALFNQQTEFEIKMKCG